MTSVTLSMEIELGWGVHEFQGYHRLSPDRREETKYLKKLLTACDLYGIGFSFDIVGHLLLEECNGNHEGPYPENWFDEDPGTSVDEDPLFYAPDLVNAVRDADVDHEICTHSFSHINCEEHAQEVVTHDLELAQQLHAEKLGEQTQSFVPPKHKIPPAESLHETNIDVIRLAEDNNESKPKKFKTLFFGPHPSIKDSSKEGIHVAGCTPYPSLTSSLLPVGQRQTHPVFRYMPLPTSFRLDLHRRWLKRAVEEAIDTDTQLHLWCHLYDIACEEQWQGIEAFLHDLEQYKKDGEVEIKRLKDIH